jgi:hypothetical protein
MVHWSNAFQRGVVDDVILALILADSQNSDRGT